MIDKATLRQQMGTVRRSMSPEEQQKAALLLARKLHKHPAFLRSQRIAAYVASNGEIDPLPLIRHADRLGKKIFLPVIQGQHLKFARYQPCLTGLTANRYGILEPVYTPESMVEANQLDLVLVPLIAFDKQGGRVGMGGGYYDRTFAFKHTANPHSRPRLVGIAHACQQIDKSPNDPWDVPLSAVATDRNIFL